ncbi:hypothetical protein SETIT_1G077600v2 [Setaria italica]|nr:MADS-box protein FLOWERING LOCUS C [Setaria italica]RCV05359.1 hypothetical protein SETIT_1G077600v2 [Setaria italica]
MAKEPEMVAVAEAGGERKRKKTLGRQKIEIKRIKCASATHVCFSKRRNGLYKKATELCVLTGASLAIVVFSPADKPYSLGYPSVHAVLEGYLDPASYVPPTAAEAAALAAAAREYECERERLDKALEAEKRRRIALDAAARAAGVWTGDDDVRLKGMPELVAMLAALERVQAEANMMQRAHEVIAEEAIMMQQCAAAAGAGDAAISAFQFEYPGAGTFTADGAGGAGGSSYYQEAMGAQMMLMGGNVVSHGAHAPLPFAPMLLPPDLPPQPHFNYGSDRYNIAGYGYGYGYDLVDGSNHGAAYEMEGFHGTRTTTTCNFFG